ncbi:hypothetical protein VTJ04DRAFT_3112 [Mycothermus thermophilus]|uniref:uncharacterized protein n=1 Tax=Humicola insolens TaxID=85995 RepID=UPI0037446C90
MKLRYTSSLYSRHGVVDASEGMSRGLGASKLALCLIHLILLIPLLSSWSQFQAFHRAKAYPVPSFQPTTLGLSQSHQHEWNGGRKRKKNCNSNIKYTRGSLQQSVPINTSKVPVSLNCPCPSSLHHKKRESMTH